jgi:hypothetical protein
MHSMGEPVASKLEFDRFHTISGRIREIAVYGGGGLHFEQHPPKTVEEMYKMCSILRPPTPWSQVCNAFLAE